MTLSGKREAAVDWIWFLVWAIASSAWCLTAAAQLGATFDEGTDIARGIEWWRDGTHRSLLKVGTMPLPTDIDTLPLYLWERRQGTPLDLANDLDAVLPWARAGTLLFWWLLLVYGRLMGRQVAGPWGGRLAVALLACEPSLLAHASLATKDIAVSACLLALVYHFRVGRDRGWWRRVGLPAFWFAASVLAKASGLVFGPICLLMVELERLIHSGAFRHALVGSSGQRPKGRLEKRVWLRQRLELLQPCRRDGFQLMALGLVLVFLYCGSDWLPEPSFVAWAHRLPDGLFGQTMVWLAEHLRIFSNAGEGLVKQITHNCRGHGVYLLGKTAPRAFWYYFPVALSMKLSLPLLVLPLLLAAVSPRSLANGACYAAAALLAFSVVCRVQIGIRLVLPLVVLAVVGLAAAIARAWRESGPGWRRAILGFAACAAIGWTASASFMVWPDGLCYTNELWGGTQRGYFCLSDSNYDWGQGLKELALWQKRREVKNLDVWYFGTDPSLKTLPMQSLPLHDLPLKDASDVMKAVRGHYLAASTTFLYGAFENTPAHHAAASFLRTCRPVDRTPTFLIYDFTNIKTALERHHR